MAAIEPGRKGTGSPASRAADGDVPTRQAAVLPRGIRVPSWYARAGCAGIDPELFYPQDPDTTSAAKAICRGCQVRALCLDDALRRREQHGIWGGLDEHERRALQPPGPPALPADQSPVTAPPPDTPPAPRLRPPARS
jgi:WhiB family redox-sensing transcriptional regulator